MKFDLVKNHEVIDTVEAADIYWASLDIQQKYPNSSDIEIAPGYNSGLFVDDGVTFMIRAA